MQVRPVFADYWVIWLCLVSAHACMRSKIATIPSMDCGHLTPVGSVSLYVSSYSLALLATAQAAQ